MNNHQYWGKVKSDWAGFSSNITFKSKYFDDIEAIVFLGDDLLEEDKIVKPPSNSSLDEFEKTYTRFLNDLDNIISEIMNKTFKRYLNLYAHYYEHQERSNEPPLNITTPEKHFALIKDLLYIRVLKDGNIQIPIHYQIDTEHGIEIRLENNRIIKIGGIAET